MTFNSAAFAAMVNASMSGGPGAVKTEEQPQPAAAAEELKDALRRLPHSKQTEMALVKERLENSLREEAAANAAVAAVAKVCIRLPCAFFRCFTLVCAFCHIKDGFVSVEVNWHLMCCGMCCADPSNQAGGRHPGEGGSCVHIKGHAAVHGGFG